MRETKIVRQANNNNLSRLSEAVIGFCGKTYPVIYYIDFLTNYPKQIIHPFYDLKDLKIFVNENPKLKEYSIDYFYSKYPWNRFQEHFDTYSRSTNNLSNTFTEYKVPIFLYQKYQDKLTLNPILADWKFYKIIDSWTAFQEISMYVSNVLVEPSKPIPVMKDEDFAEIKGFDKYSFRKDKKS